jgi:hypothetical protein
LSTTNPTQRGLASAVANCLSHGLSTRRIKGAAKKRSIKKHEENQRREGKRKEGNVGNTQSY